MMADETVIISNLPTHTPAGSDYLAIENSTETGKNTLDTIVAAATQVQTNASNIATNTAAISQLNSKLSKTSGTYTPTFSWSNGTGLTVSHVAFDYHYLAGVLFVQGRMNITSLGTPGNSNLLVTLPSGYSFAAGVGGFGMVVQDSGVLPLVVRAQGTNLCIVNGPGGYYASTVINSTGFIGIQATLPVG